MKENKLERVPGTDIPDFLPAEQTGAENMTPEDVVLPRLQICQALSPQRKKKSALYIENLEEGDMFNTVNSRNYGKNLQVVPVIFQKSRVFFLPLEQGGGINCSSPNGIDGGRLSTTCGTCKHSTWKENGDKPDCQKFYNYVSLVYPTFEPVIVSMKSSAVKIAKRWNALIRERKVPVFSQIYNLASVEEESAGQSFYNFQVQRGNFLKEDPFKIARMFYESIREKPVSVDHTEPENKDSDIPF